MSEIKETPVEQTLKDVQRARKMTRRMEGEGVTRPGEAERARKVLGERLKKLLDR